MIAITPKTNGTFRNQATDCSIRNRGKTTPTNTDQKYIKNVFKINSNQLVAPPKNKFINRAASTTCKIAALVLNTPKNAP